MRNKQKCLMASICCLVFLLASCGGGGGSGGGGGGSSSSSSGGTTEPQTFSVEVNSVIISRLDNEETVATEGSGGTGATITIE